MAERAPPPSYEEAVKSKPMMQEVLREHMQQQQQPRPPVHIVVEQSFAPYPQRMVCPSCHAHVETRVKYRPNSNTHLIALLLCFLFWPCALYPYCIDTCKDAMHYCPECGTYLGTYTN